MVFTERSTLFITMMTCVLTGKIISADIVFSMAQFFNVLQVRLFYAINMLNLFY